MTLTTAALTPAASGEESEDMTRTSARDDRTLRWTGAVMLVALLVHGTDHARRGLDIVTTQVLSAGAIQFLLGVVAVVLVFRSHRVAPLASIAIGFAGGLGFMAAHLLPQWGTFSDPFTGADVAPRVTALSWGTAAFEIIADFAFGATGVAVLRRRGRSRQFPEGVRR